MLESILTGKTTDHLIKVEDDEKLIHKDILPSYLNLKKMALKDGIRLKIISGFRSFEHQSRIWNDKISGKRTLWNYDGTKKLDIRQLKSQDLIKNILRWSALPGTSRHHWGTDLDIIDLSEINSSYKIQLTPDEFMPNGPFFKLNTWLIEKISSNQSFGFFRPYDKDLGGVAQEPWHLSYAPLSECFQNSFSEELFNALLGSINFTYKQDIIEIKSYIFNQFIQNTCPAPKQKV